MNRVALLVRFRHRLYRFEKHRDPHMRHNWRIAILFWLDKRIVALGRHALFDWYGAART
jgi:hypothetical protein